MICSDVLEERFDEGLFFVFLVGFEAIHATEDATATAVASVANSPWLQEHGVLSDL